MCAGLRAAGQAPRVVRPGVQFRPQECQFRVQGLIFLGPALQVGLGQGPTVLNPGRGGQVASLAGRISRGRVIVGLEVAAVRQGSEQVVDPCRS